MNTTTVTIQIGNSDDKLTQKQWSEFYLAVDTLVRDNSARIHFAGTPPSYVQWQNAAWVIEVTTDKTKVLINSLCSIRKQYQQDSVAWTPGVTTFI